MIEAILLSIDYISSVPYFWATMGFITAISILITSAIYDDDTLHISKGLVNLLSFSMVLIWITLIRVNSQEVIHNIPQAYAGITTTILTSFFWSLGMILRMCSRIFRKR